MAVVSVENDDQRALRLWLTAGLAIPEVVQLHGDAGYLLNNMIAKYTLASDTYAISVGALGEFEARDVDLSAVYSRRKFYGAQGGDNPFIYEHSIPAGVVRDELLRGRRSSAAVSRALRAAGVVTVLLRSEDTMLKRAGLNSKMPEGWEFGYDVFARYHAVGIAMSDHVLRVSGAICR